MKYRPLGRTGYQVSEISFGAWAIGGSWGKVDDEESMAALHKAVDLGVNFFDTADVYGDGRSERLLARLKRDLDEATRLQKKRIEYDRRAAQGCLHQKPSEMSTEARGKLRQLADSLFKLAEIERENKDHACIATYMEASRLLRRLGDKKQAARCLFNLGLAYTYLPKYRDLPEAEKWFIKSMELVEEEDVSWKGRCLTQIATTTYERFLDGQKANRPEEELVPVLNRALEQYFDALDVIAEDDSENLAIVYNMIGAIYVHADNMAEALKYYDEAIAIKQSSGDILGAADIGFNVAIALFLDNRLEDGRQYAEAALKGYESLGSQAARQASKTRGLLVRFGFGKQPLQAA